ncbi:hypothetical protein ACUM5Y_12070 [Marinomonas dokdonensis]|uniref:hypothetical protein n=1 Tax=Marinomonas dokdonensis TaxID=328224 RepID=UPI004055593E
MARKANISKEEIHLACWALLEKNTFPNIPRIAEYFINKDGRKCSNTTLLNAITEWEEIYKEHQQHQLKQLDDVMSPVFQRFNRDVTQSLGKLLDEITFDLEQGLDRKDKAVNGGYLSLSKTLIQCQEELDHSEDKLNQLAQENQSLQEKVETLTQRNQDLAATNNVLTAQISQLQEQHKELVINLAQKDVDLAKIDNELAARNKEYENALRKQQQLEEDNRKLEQENWQKIRQQLDSMNNSINTLSAKHGDKKD